MPASLGQFLESCREAEKALALGSLDAATGLARCTSQLAQAQWNPGELELAGKALMQLRIKAESKSRFLRIRANLAQTLARASSGGLKAAAPKVDRVY